MTHHPETAELQRLPDDVIERVARAWAGIDGKTALFDECKVDPEAEEAEGTYEGYRSDAEELLRRSDLAAQVIRLTEALRESDRLLAIVYAAYVSFEADMIENAPPEEGWAAQVEAHFAALGGDNG
ncbi:MAG: hypothetical protein DI533_00550 [Cereibacter sphaeroides]|uniref:Uncharacterized protein n=1 Tax=Cereibacter sphaeroides TaxID=1063 RepID=A0A2W5S848_CERSP|nr:MAG: hypothetical protein DI533_00550 [Cereibacter sphaeroides]